MVEQQQQQFNGLFLVLQRGLFDSFDSFSHLKSFRYCSFVPQKNAYISSNYQRKLICACRSDRMMRFISISFMSHVELERQSLQTFFLFWSSPAHIKLFSCSAYNV